jgi:hypothetical protein
MVYYSSPFLPRLWLTHFVGGINLMIKMTGKDNDIFQTK